MSEENKSLVRRMMMDIWRDGKLETIDDYFADNFVNNTPGSGQSPDRDGLKEFAAMLGTAFTDGTITVNDQISEGDRVVTRWSSTTTHSGDFMGVPATGNKVSVRGIDISRVEGGKVVEGWSEADMMGLMAQIGALPDSGEG